MSESNKKDTTKSVEADKENKEKKKTDLGLLEEDDEFEEFPAEGMLIYFVWLIVYSDVTIIF